MSSQGTATLDFGAFPGASDASVFVAAPTITGASLVEAWIFPAATPDHSADEHLVETLRVMAGNVQAGVGFTIYGFNTSQLNEPLKEFGQGRNHRSIGTAAQSTGYGANTHVPSVGGQGTRLYGKFNVAWVWN
jgi:hypothetical protein